MKLSYLKIAGFRGVRGELEVQIPAGFLVISGQNGSGKTTICDAIEFALTGSFRPTPSRGEKGETLKEYTWWRGSDLSAEPTVVLGVKKDEGEVVEIRRGPDALITSNGESIPELLCPDAPYEGDCIAQLCRTAILRDEDITRLSLDMPETERFEFVRSSLGTSGYSEVEARAENVYKLLAQRLESTRGEYSRVRERISDLVAQVSEVKVQSTTSDALAEAENTIRAILAAQPGDSIDLTESGLAESSRLRADGDDLEPLAERYGQLLDRIEQLQTGVQEKAIHELRSQIARIEDEAKRAKGRLTSVDESLAEFHARQPEAASLANLLEHGRKYGLTSGRCPLCGLSVSPGEFEGHLKLIEDRVSAESGSLVKLTERRAEMAATIEHIEHEHKALAQRLKELLDEEQAALNELAELRKMASKSGVDISHEDQRVILENIRKRLDTMRATVRRLNEALGTIEASKLHKRLDDLGEELAVAQEVAGDRESEMQRIQEASERAKAAYDTVRRAIGENIEEQLAELNPLLEELFIRLKPHTDWREIRYHIRGDVRRFLSLDLGGGVNPSYIFSSGQRRVTGLAFLLAIHMSRWWCKLDTLVMDDAIQHIDDYRALHLAEILGAVRRTGRQLICTVEDPALAELLGRRLRSTTEEPGMHLELDYRPGAGVGISSSRVIRPMSGRTLLAA